MFPTLVPNSWVQDILLPQRGQQQGRGLQLHIVLGGFHNAFLLGLLQVLKNVDFYVPEERSPKQPRNSVGSEWCCMQHLAQCLIILEKFFILGLIM